MDAKQLANQVLTILVSKLKELVVDKPEVSLRDNFAEMWVADKKEDKKEEPIEVKMPEEKDILLELEAYQRDKEQMAKQKEEIESKEVSLKDREYSLEKANQELTKNGNT